MGLWAESDRTVELGLGLIHSLGALPDPFPSLPQDPERLCFLSMMLRPFHVLLGRLGNQGGWTSSEKMQLWTVRLDLRDLQRHLHFQVGCPPTSSPPRDRHKTLKLIGSLLKTPSAHRLGKFGGRCFRSSECVAGRGGAALAPSPESLPSLGVLV